MALSSELRRFFSNKSQQLPANNIRAAEAGAGGYLCNRVLAARQLAKKRGLNKGELAQIICDQAAGCSPSLSESCIYRSQSETPDWPRTG